MSTVRTIWQTTTPLMGCFTDLGLGQSGFRRTEPTIYRGVDNLLNFDVNGNGVRIHYGIDSRKLLILEGRNQMVLKLVEDIIPSDCDPVVTIKGYVDALKDYLGDKNYNHFVSSLNVLDNHLHPNRLVA